MFNGEVVGVEAVTSERFFCIAVVKSRIEMEQALKEKTKSPKKIRNWIWHTLEMRAGCN